MASESLKKWNNGDSGAVVKEVIEYNFNLLYKRLAERSFSKTFTKSDWKNGAIYIGYDEHRIANPISHVMMLSNNGRYIDVYGGSYVDDNESVCLQSDIPFDGKVVIK